MGLWDRITSQFIEIVEWLEDDHEVITWRFPVRGQEIKNGAKLVVREGQVACFISEGQLADVFSPGTYTLATENLPILASLRGWKYGFNSPFKAEVYFVHTTQFTNLKWGTQNPVMLRDPEFGPLRLRAFGVFSIRVTDAKKFLRTVVGTDSVFEVEEILGQLKRSVVSKFSQALGSAQIPALDLAGNYDRIADKVRPVIHEEFQEMGLGIPSFVVENISLPASVEKVLDARSEMAVIGNMQNFTAYQMANALPDAAANPNSMVGAGMGLAAGMAAGQQMAGALHPQGMATPAGQGVVGGAPTSGGTPGQPSMVERFKKLDALKAAGILTDEEYEAKRAEILAEI